MTTPPARSSLLIYSSRTQRASRLLELALAFLRPLLARRMRPLGQEPVICLVEPFQMGDVLSLAPMLEPILARFPRAHIVVWCHSRAGAVFASDPRVHRILAAPFPWSARGSKRGTPADWLAVARIALQARKLHIDAAIDTRGDVRSQALMLLAGCRQRIGFTTYVHSNLEVRGLLLTHPLGTPQSQHRFQSNLESLTPLFGGIPALHLPALQVQPQTRVPGSGSPTAPRLILLHPGAGWLYRRWPVDRWAALIGHLQTLPEIRLIQIAGPGEQDLALQLNALLSVPIETLSTNFEGLLEMLATATLFIGLDSGPMNAAALLNRPVVALFGPGIASMWSPLSTGSAWLQHIEAYPCHPCTQITCVRPDEPCISTIQVDEVFAAAIRILNEAPLT